jgi:NitT/TauT family transport system substrate-binding protein
MNDKCNCIKVSHLRHGGLPMMIRRLHYLAGTVAGTVIAVALAGCSSPGGTAGGAAGPQGLRAITVDAVPAAEEGGLYVAQAQGFFAQFGLTVKINSIAGAQTGIPDLQSGRAELVAGNYVPFIMAQMAGSFDRRPVSMRIIAAGSEIQPGSEALYVMPHSRFQTLAELARAHARIGLDAAHDAGEVMVGALLAQAGYRLGDIRQVIPAAGFPALLGMLSSGRVDAAWLPQPLGETAEQRIGALPLTDFDQGSLQDFPFTGYLGSTQWVRAHPDTVAAFLRALDEGQQLADTDRAAVESAMERYTDVPPVIADTMAIDSYPLEMDVPQLQRVADSMYEFGLTPGARAPYRIAGMIQPEPGLTGG